MSKKPKSEENDKKSLKTLTDEDIVTTDHGLNRRSALRAIGAVAVGAVAAAVVLRPGEAAAQTDRDPSDGVGRGYTGVTDGDAGGNADRPGHGRRRRVVRRRTGFTDRDAGPRTDGTGYGVCPSRGHSDSDSGDPAGRGRGPCQ
jgi:hypothetical protein